VDSTSVNGKGYNGHPQVDGVIDADLILEDLREIIRED
jgi:hypothetical protein